MVRSRLFRPAVAATLAVVVAACVSGGGDDDGGSLLAGLDIRPADGAAVIDADGSPADAPSAIDDAATDVAADVAPTDGAQGADDTPTDEAQDAGGVVEYDDPRFCRPCEGQAACGDVAGSVGFACVPEGDGSGSFCGPLCTDDADCGSEHECRGQGEAKACRPAGAACGCTAESTESGASTVCVRRNDHGECVGRRACGAGGLQECSAATPSAEVCNGVDDDCDGETDEGFRVGQACDGDDADDCAAGRWACSADGSGAVCEGDSAGGGAEVCDGADNDCDGETDEGEDLPGCTDYYRDGDGDGYGNDNRPIRCLCGPELATDYAATEGGDCDDGLAGINPGAKESCITPVDDDCDGSANGLDGEGCTDFYADADGDGEAGPAPQCWCAAKGDYKLAAGGADCDDGDAAIKPGADEACNGADDDCDGETDEDFADLGAACDGADTDECAHGVRECAPSGQGTVCGVEDPADVVELCNGEDDDCDGATDEGLGLGEPCDGSDDDQCANGVLICDLGSGGTLCGPEDVRDIAEACNGVDDDCDGETDEGFGLGEPCDGPDSDQCAHGEVICGDDGELACGPESKRDLVEICNGRDDDCDGETDEGFAVGEACDGPDSDLCAHGVLACNAAGDGVICGAEDPVDVVERCDGVDDDCDGETDERFIGLGEPCDGPDADQCAGGVQRCTDDGAGTFCADDLSESGGERCNGHDDNCNGEIDEGFLIGRPCDGDDADACINGLTICAPDGEGTTCGPESPADIPELCNGADDDCDGEADEGLGLGEPCDGDDADECADGVKVCGDDGEVACEEGGEGRVETCDGTDEDCDGETDEDFPLGEPCDGDDADECAHGTWVCGEDGQAVCSAETVAAIAERCNGTDDDCDGAIDEGFDVGGACDSGDPDDCANGLLVCNDAGDGVRCLDDYVTQGREFCNGRDDDCDGEFDEDFADLGQPCDGDDADLCANGTWRCAPDQESLVCGDESITDIPERCNGVDDDCDGATDEDFPTLGDACAGAGGGCSNGTLTCRDDGSGVVCTGTTEVPERCNGVDDDCDGAIDEDWPRLGEACDGNDADACALGTWACAADGAGLVCDGDESPTAEVCNGVDDDCDGRTDESHSGDRSNGGHDFPDFWSSTGPRPGIYPSSSSGTVRGRVLPSADRDWFRIKATENLGWLDDPDGCFNDAFIANITLHPPGGAAVFKMTACWSTVGGQCSETTAESRSASDGSVSLSITGHHNDCGTPDTLYLDVMIEVTSGSPPWSCDEWRVDWSMNER